MDKRHEKDVGNTLQKYNATRLLRRNHSETLYRKNAAGNAVAELRSD